MIDFVKCWLKYPCIENLLKTPDLKFCTTYNDQTGEIRKQVAVYKNLTFIINKGRVTLKGSLHKYKNNGEQNYDDFTWSDLGEVLYDLQVRFNIELQHCVLQNLEIGVNIVIPIACYLILNNLMFHYGVIFKDVNVKSGNYKIAEHQRYSVKVYDKSLQYKNRFNISDRILRFEIHYSKMISLNRDGIYTLEDLIKEEHHDVFLKLLIGEWEKILLFDCTIDTNGLSKNVRTKKMLEWCNIRFWEDLTKQAKDRQKKDYNTVVKGHSNRVFDQVKYLLIEKWNQLTEMDTN